MTDWKPKLTELGPGVVMGQDTAPPAIELVKDLLTVLHPELAGMTLPYSPKEVWEYLLAEVRELKEKP